MDDDAVDPWAPVHHEDAALDDPIEDQPPPAQRRRAAPAKPTQSRRAAPAANDTDGDEEEDEARMTVPVRMSVDVPPDLFGAIHALVNQQMQTMKRLEELSEQVGELLDLFNSRAQTN